MLEYKFVNNIFGQKRDTSNYPTENSYSSEMIAEIFYCVKDKDDHFFEVDVFKKLQTVLKSLKINKWIKDFKLDCHIDCKLYDNGWASISTAILYDSGKSSVMQIQAKVNDCSNLNYPPKLT